MEFRLKTRKQLFTVRRIKHWNRLSREVASSTEIIKTQPEVILGKLSCLSGGVGLCNSKGPRQPL